MMRPWTFDFPEVSSSFTPGFGETEYMLGPSLLVAPVTSSTDKVEVLLPRKGR